MGGGGGVHTKLFPISASTLPMRAPFLRIKHHPPLFYTVNTHSKAKTLRPQQEEGSSINISLDGWGGGLKKKGATQDDLCYGPGCSQNFLLEASLGH